MNILWSAQLNASPVTDYQIVGELLLVIIQSPESSSSSAHLMALDHVNGELRWSRLFDNVAVSGLEANLDTNGESRIYVTASDRDFLVDEVLLYCYDQHGEQCWLWRENAQTISAPTFYKNVLSFTIDSEVLVYLDAVTGLERFRVELQASVSFAAQCWYDGRIYLPGNGPHLLAVEASGIDHWLYQGEGTEWLDKTPVIAGEYVLTSNSKGAMLALHLVDGKQVWQTAVGPAGRQLSPPTTDGQHVYVGARDGLYALDVKNGEKIWTFPTGRSVTARPSIHGNVIYMTSHDHHVYAIDASNGQEIWRYQMDRYIELSPAIREHDKEKNFTIYVIDRGGKIVALQPQLSSQSVSASVERHVNTQNITEIIEQLEADGEITLAAEAWFEAGELERAAEQFELADKWQRAAGLWKKSGRYLKYAQALEGYANSIEDEGRENKERVMAWDEAAKAYEAEGEKAKAEFCRLQVSKYEQQPVLDLSIEHDGFVQNVWSKLKLTIFNNGYGPARRVDIQVSGEQFEGQIASSKYFFKLLPGEDLFVLLTVRPLQYGDSVPMKIKLEYQDNQVQMRHLVKTIFVPVAPKRSERVVGQIQNVFATAAISTKVVKNIANITDKDLVELRRNLVAYFNINELRDLCFELNIDDEELMVERKSEFAREIILYLKRRGRLQDLISFCMRTRPHIGW